MAGGGGSWVGSTKTAMFSSFDLCGGNWMLLACARDRKDRAANDFDPRRTCSGDPSPVSQKSSLSSDFLLLGDGVSMTAELDLSPVDASNGVLAVSDRHERYGRGVWQALDEAIATDLAAAVKRSDFASFGASSRAGASLMDILEDKMQEGEKLMEQSVEEAIQSLESGELNVPYSVSYSLNTVIRNIQCQLVKPHQYPSPNVPWVICKRV